MSSTKKNEKIRRGLWALAALTALVGLTAVPGLAGPRQGRQGHAVAQFRGGGDPMMGRMGHRRGGQGHKGRGDRLERMLDPGLLDRVVDLSDEQKEQVRELRVQLQKAKIKRKADTELAMLDLKEALRSYEPDRKAVDRLTKKIADLHAAALSSTVDAVMSLKKILTAEQHEQLLKALESRRGPRGRRGGRGFGPGDDAPPPPPAPEAPRADND